jgi:UDP-N-acetylmuramate dehydrogenase
MREKILQLTNGLIQGEIIFNEMLSRHTTWRVGGPADCLIVPCNLEDVINIVKIAKEEKIPLNLIGNGSNLLIKDKGLRGITIKIGSALSRHKVEDLKITADAGLKLAKLIHIANDAGIGGFEFGIGIPANIGGAVVMNAGAYGGAMEQIVKEVLVVNSFGELVKLSLDQLGFGYRKSNLQSGNDIIVEVTFQGAAGDSNELKTRAREILAERKGKQPLQYPNAGSVFKNPPDEIAGKLIDLAGCKGFKVGGAEVSRLHANFIINNENAKAQDIIDLIEKVQETVSRKFGIYLQPEVRVMGD